MMNRDEAIKGLETMLSNYDALDEIEINKGNQMLLMHRAIAKCALELLKEQEVKPVLIREGKSKLYNDYRCPRCDNEIVYEQNYCSECGSVVKWE